MKRWDWEYVILWAFIALFLGFVSFIGFDAYVRAKSPEIALKKSEWFCSKTEARTVLMPVMVGKLLVHTPRQVTVCVRYDRKGG